MSRDFAANDMKFFRSVVKYNDSEEWLFNAGPYSTAGMAKAQGTHAVRPRWDDEDPRGVAKVQVLAAVLSYEDHYSFEGHLVTTPTPKLEWVDYVK